MKTDEVKAFMGGRDKKTLSLRSVGEGGEEGWEGW